MRLPKTDCIFEINIKKYVKKNKFKIDTRNYRNNTLDSDSELLIRSKLVTDEEC